MLDSLIDKYCRALSVAMVACLAAMVVLVFGNVLLRYAFNTGIAISDELARWLFVWMTFMGAIVALRERGHLGTDFVVRRLPLAARKACMAIGHVGMLFICWLLFKGALEQARINAGTTSAAMEAPVAWFYGSGVVFAVSGGALLALDLLRLLAGRLRDDEVLAVRESEEVGAAGAAPAPAKGPAR